MAFYHIKYILWLFLSTLSTVGLANTTTLNVGCFNIRFKTSADQGELSWNNRKSYVTRTIIDFKYDIVGVNEMNAGSQQEDMKSLLPEYSFVEWEETHQQCPIREQSMRYCFVPISSICLKKDITFCVQTPRNHYFRGITAAGTNVSPYGPS